MLNDRESPVDHYESWGRCFHYHHQLEKLSWLPDRLSFIPDEVKALPYAYGRSYGDSCLNDQGLLIDTSGLTRLMHFDRSKGIIRCEAGVRFDQLLEVILPHGWFLPVTPGTKYISVGGAIANDVHGKNHHTSGTFGNFVSRFEMLRSNGERIVCSHWDNQELFKATIGGLGLTGLITWAEFRLSKVGSPYMDVVTTKFSGIEEFFEIADAADKQYEYTVAWVDCLAKDQNLGRGIFMAGNHSSVTNESALAKEAFGKQPKLSIPFDMPGWLLSPLFMKAFNTLYYNKQLMKRRRHQQHFDPFFYPLDGIGDWNRLYGKRGFFQYQFVLPDKHRDVLPQIFELIAKSNQASCLAVLKKFGEQPSPGMLSFPRPGITLALDFANRGQATHRLFTKLDECIAKVGGRLYPAKDGHMQADFFKSGYPEWRTFSSFIDPKFSSSFWERVSQ